MQTFDIPDAVLATIILTGKLMEALHRSGALPEAQGGSAVKQAVDQLDKTGNEKAAAVLRHYFEAWLQFSQT